MRPLSSAPPIMYYSMAYVRSVQMDSCDPPLSRNRCVAPRLAKPSAPWKGTFLSRTRGVASRVIRGQYQIKTKIHAKSAPRAAYPAGIHASRANAVNSWKITRRIIAPHVISVQVYLAPIIHTSIDAVGLWGNIHVLARVVCVHLQNQMPSPLAVK